MTAALAVIALIFSGAEIGAQQPPPIQLPPPVQAPPVPPPTFPLPEPPLPQPFDNPANPGDRIMQLQIPGNSAGRLPLQRPPTPNPGRLRASAGFEPAVISLKRFGEYRVTITGARHGVELPEPLPVPEGLVISASGRALGAQILGNGERVDTVTFR